MIIVEKFGKRWAVTCSAHEAIGENTTVTYATERARLHQSRQSCAERAYVIERRATARWVTSRIEPEGLVELGYARSAPLARQLADNDSRAEVPA